VPSPFHGGRDHLRHTKQATISDRISEEVACTFGLEKGAELVDISWKRDRLRSLPTDAIVSFDFAVINSANIWISLIELEGGKLQSGCNNA